MLCEWAEISFEYQLRPPRPVTLTDAYWLYVHLEQGAPVRKPFQQWCATAKSPSFHKQYTSNQDKITEFKAPVATQRARDPGKCQRCGDQWFHGHKCKQAPVINLLTGEDPADNTMELEEMEANEQEEKTKCRGTMYANFTTSPAN